MRKKIIIAIFVIIVIAAAVLVVYNQRFFQQTDGDRLTNKYSGQIEKIVSSKDQDNDGIDDQTDILENAIAYVKTKPKYKSKYYNTGYPNDKFGVCTDVVANAFRGAGYDLMKLVEEDYAKNPEGYDIEIPDPNIDFRRVNNLKAYFDHNAISLTKDINDIEKWQGGDVVVFNQHIGIISDRRNADGVPYVIHHNDPLQKSYEENLLEKRRDVIGHYRISQ